MASKSQFINRPWVGWYDDADILQIILANDNGTDGVKFTTSPNHGYSTDDNVQFLVMRKDGGINEGKQFQQTQVYNSLGYKGRRPKSTADGVVVIDADEFWLGAEEWPFSGLAEGLVVKPKFRSDWVAAFNPVVYEFVRGDDNVNDILSAPARLVMDTLVAADFPANRKIKLRDKYALEVQGDDQDGIFTVLSASGSPATVTLNETLVQVFNKFGLVVIDELRVNWRLEVEVFADDISGLAGMPDVLLTPNPLIYQSPADGDIEVDISSILASQFDFDSVLPLSLDQG